MSQRMVAAQTEVTTHQMSTKRPDSDPEHSETPEQQLTLDEAEPPARCKAYAESTGERCRHTPMGPLPYCADHRHLLDDVDRRELGLKPPITQD